MLRNLFPQTVLAAGLAVASSAAIAVPIDFSVSAGSISLSGFSFGSSVSVNPLIPLSSDPETFNFPDPLDLDGGPTSYTFSFFDILVTGYGAGAGTINASLDFTSPTVNGADGHFQGAFAVTPWGSGGILNISDQPDPIAFDGGLFDVVFHGDWDACDHCESLKGTVKATVSLMEGPRTSVPEPGTLALLGTGILAFGISRRFRRRL